jgi:quinol monooxygenase YgiN
MVTRRVQAGKEEETEVILRDLQAATLANDKGCLRYEWYRASTAQTYILLERWADQAAVQEHLKALHFVSAIEKLSPLVLENPRWSGCRGCDEACLNFNTRQIGASRQSPDQVIRERRRELGRPGGRCGSRRGFAPGAGCLSRNAALAVRENRMEPAFERDNFR